MALNVVHQREIVEVPFDMPDGRMHRYNLFLKNAYFEPLVNKILENVVWGNDEID